MSVKQISELKAIDTQMVVLDGTVWKKVHESDGDYHIEIKDSSSDSTVVCEAIPSNQSVYSIAHCLPVGSHVSIAGYLFKDRRHHPSKLRTRNFIEIHPILSIK